MISNEAAKALHDRATRGLPLSANDQADLEAWYARQDAEEETVLKGSAPSEQVPSLRAQVDEVLAQLALTTGRVQALAAENERLRREIKDLELQVAQSLAAPRA